MTVAETIKDAVGLGDEHRKSGVGGSFKATAKHAQVQQRGRRCLMRNYHWPTETAVPTS